MPRPREQIHRLRPQGPVIEHVVLEGLEIRPAAVPGMISEVELAEAEIPGDLTGGESSETVFDPLFEEGKSFSAGGWRCG